MAVNQNFTNSSRDKPFFGTGSDDGVFPNGISIATTPTTELNNFTVSSGIVSLAAIDPATNDLAPFQAAVFYSGSAQQGGGYYSIDDTTINWTGNTINQQIPIVSATDINSVNQVALTNISSINGVAPGASPVSYISSINLPAVFPSGLNASAKGFASTLMAGMPTGSTIQAQMDIEVDAPGGSNVIGTLWAGMGTQTGGVNFFTPVYFNTANPASATVVSMNGLINIPLANDGIVIALSNGSTGGLLPVEALGLKLSLVSI